MGCSVIKKLSGLLPHEKYLYTPLDDNDDNESENMSLVLTIEYGSYGEIKREKRSIKCLHINEQ